MKTIIIMVVSVFALLAVAGVLIWYFVKPNASTPIPFPSANATPAPTTTETATENHIQEDNMSWTRTVEVRDVGRFLLHGKTEPKFVDTLVQTLDELGDFLRSANFEKLPLDEKGGNKSYDIYLLAPDEKVGVASNETKDTTTYLESAYGFVHKSDSISLTEQNLQDFYSYMVLDNGIPLSPENKSLVKDDTDARLTLVHELFHSIQFALADEEPNVWFMEGCASATEVLFELYFAKIRESQHQRIFQEYGTTFMTNLRAGFNSTEPNVAYGTYLFILYVLQTTVLAKRFPNTRSAMQNLWSQARSIAMSNKEVAEPVSITCALTRIVNPGNQTENLVAWMLLEFISVCAETILRLRGANLKDDRWADEMHAVKKQLEDFLVSPTNNPTKAPNPKVVIIATTAFTYPQDLAPLGGSITFVRKPASTDLQISLSPPLGQIACFFARKDDGSVESVPITNLKRDVTNPASKTFLADQYQELVVCVVNTALS
jgi:hypothetical protein